MKNVKRKQWEAKIATNFFFNNFQSSQEQQLIENLVDEQQRHKVAYATEGGQFTNAGIPTVICGPGDIGNAHKANEFVSLNQLAKCESFLQQILQQCCDSH